MGKIGADHEEAAVREVENSENAEYERQPGRDQEDRHPEDNTVYGGKCPLGRHGAGTLALGGRRLTSRGNELQLGLQDLADGVCRQRIHHVQLLGKLLAGEARAHEESLHLRERQAAPRFQRHEGDRPLAGSWARNADDRDALDRLALQQHVLDLERADVLAQADDDLLAPPGDLEIAVPDHPPEVAGSKEIVFRELANLVLGLEIANEHAGRANHDISFGAWREHLAGLVDDAELRGDLTVRYLPLPRFSARSDTGANERDLGRSIGAGHHRILELMRCIGDERDWNARPAADEAAEGGEMASGSSRAFQQTAKERGCTGAERQPLAIDQRGRSTRIPRLHQMGGRSSKPRKLERIDRSADMPDRRRNQETVDIRQSPEGGRAPYRGMGGVVAVKHTLGPTGGSRGERDRLDAG